MSTPSRNQIWDAVIAERHQLAGELAELRPEQWSRPTACAEWDVHDVLAHLLDTARTTRRGFVLDMLRTRGDFDRANRLGVERAGRDDPADTLREFVAEAERTSTPAALVTRLTEAYLHGEDIRRALGGTGAEHYPPELVAAALEAQAQTSVRFGGSRDVADRLRLVATDTDLVLGDGVEVRGRAISLLVALSGRPVDADELDGPGAALLLPNSRASAGGSPWTKPELWAAIAAERSRLVADLERLDEEQWGAASLCDEWTVEQVVAHLTTAGSVGRLAWLRSVLGARFDFALHKQRRLAEHLGPRPADTLDGLRGVVEETVEPNGTTPAWLGEVIVHGQDIRRPLGLSTEPDRAAVLEVAHFFASRDFAVPSRTTVRGLRLEATDAPFATGKADDPTVAGPLLALVMVMAGRPAYLDELTGPEVSLLRSRLEDTD